jgi:hypothetical protein
LPSQLTKGAAMPKKKNETIEDILDRIEEDIQIIRDKAMEQDDMDDDLDDDEDIDEDEDEDEE